MIGAEYDAAGCGDNAGPARTFVLHIPLLVAGRRIERTHGAPPTISQWRNLSAHRAIAYLHIVWRRAPDETRARFANGEIERVRGLVEGRRHEVRAAIPVRTGRCAGLRRIVSGDYDGPAVATDFLCPVGVDVRFRENELAVRAIEHVEEAIAIRLHDDLADLAGHG